MKFNEKLIKLRKAQGMSQEDLGYELNVTRQTISKWELGESTPEMEKLIQISNYFGVSVDELVSNSEEVTNQNNNKEYVGIDEKYIPNDVKNDSSYVNDNKVSKKIMAIPIIVLIIPLLMSIILIAIMVSRHISFNKIRDNGKDMVENMVNTKQEEFENKVTEIVETKQEEFENKKEVVENKLDTVSDNLEQGTEEFNKEKEEAKKFTQEIQNQQEEVEKEFQEMQDNFNQMREQSNL